jgi:hypothetical protein
MSRIRRISRRRGGAGGSSLNEFAPALFVFFFLAVFPMLNLIGVAIGVATISLVAQKTVQAAANSSSYSQALTALQTTANNMMGTGFAKFAKLKPIGGFGGCGADLYVIATKFTGGSNTTKLYGPDTPVPSPLDTTNYVYEYQVRANYTVMPFINMSGIPFVNTVPGIGSPTNFSWAAHSSVEYPDGLTSGSAAAGS